MRILLEHDYRPGTSYEECLIYGGGFGCTINEMQLIETTTSSSGRKKVKFRGKFQEAEAINKNKRMYPRGILEENVKRLNEALELGLMGELDHPTDSIVHLNNASHRVTKLWWEKNTLMGEGEILSTPSGRVLQSLIDDGIKFGISSRGVGNGKVDENGILVIGESYRLITFDAVADPSTWKAYQERVVSKENFEYSDEYPEKNETSRIDKSTITENQVLAYFSGIMKQRFDEVKSRLK